MMIAGITLFVLTKKDPQPETVVTPVVQTNWIKDRISDAEDASRSAAREERIKKRQEARQEARQQARQEARQAARQAARQQARQDARQAQQTAQSSQSSSSSSQSSSGLNWDALAECESGGNWSINTGNGYYGGLQFSLSTWQANGGSGLPSDASRETQIAIAEKLYAVSGSSPWPTCGGLL